jgi:exopolyphosphatase / guanosine-5'-triphosphate,3'-diphosphate pyrophosphatase
VNASARAGHARKRRQDGGGQRLGAAEPLRYGALDLGTNNCRLLIATPGPQGFHVHDAFSRIVRLGEGLGATGALGEPAIMRTIEALRVCSNKLVWHKVARRRLIATEACRLAQNGEAFIARVKAETGLELEIIDRETEAKLAASGAEPLIDSDAESVLVFDIGGGSTEAMWVEQSGGGRHIRAWTSLPAGVVTISELFGGGREVSAEDFAAMRTHVRGLLQSFIAKVGEGSEPSYLLGTSGTVTTIAAVQMGLKRYDRSRVDGSWLEARGVVAVTQQLLAMSHDERMRNPCIGRERADLVLAGCAILEEIRAAFPSERIRVADRGLREGILTQLMKEDGVYGVGHG